jgi:hypothetical protein
MAHEIKYFIEDMDTHLWFLDDGKSIWTNSPNSCMHFASEQDATEYISVNQHFFDGRHNLQITEHIFLTQEYIQVLQEMRIESVKRISEMATEIGELKAKLKENNISFEGKGASIMND